MFFHIRSIHWELWHFEEIYEKHCLIPPNKIRERFAIWILSRRSPPGRRAAGFCACLLNRCLIKITFLSTTISFLMNCFYGNLFFVLKNYNHQKMKTPFPLVCNAIGEKYFNRSIKLHFEGLLTCLKLLTDHRYTSYNLRIRIILIIRNIVIIGMKVRNVLSTYIGRYS